MRGLQATSASFVAAGHDERMAAKMQLLCMLHWKSFGARNTLRRGGCRRLRSSCHTRTFAVFVAQSLLHLSCMAANPATRGVETTLPVLRCTLNTNKNTHPHVRHTQLTVKK